MRTGALAFAAVAVGLAALHPTPAHAAGTVVQGESLKRSNTKMIKVRPDSAAGRQKTLAYRKSRSSASKRLTVGANRLTIRVRGTRCMGAPKAVVRIDGKRVMSVRVPQRRYTTKSTRVAIKRGSHKLTVSYPNDRRTSRCDRNLYLDYVRFSRSKRGAAPAPAPAPGRAPAKAPAAAPAPAPAPPALWGSTFEDGNVGIYKTVRTEGSGTRGSHVITTETARTGVRSMKITLPAASSGGTVGRYQLVAGMPDGKPGDDRWYGFSLKLGNDWDLSQIQDNRSYFLGGTGFRYTGTSVNGPGANLDGAVVGGAPTFLMGSNLSSSVGTDHSGEHNLGAIVKNQWIDVVLHVKWSTGGDGIREAWRNGVQVGAYRGPTLGVSSPFEHRMGIYEGTAVNHTRTMYVDNHRVGTSYAAVDPSR